MAFRGVFEEESEGYASFLGVSTPVVLLFRRQAAFEDILS